MKNEIHSLMEKLVTIQGKNVDITLANESNGVLMFISTEKFSSSMDEFYITLDNNCHDSNFDIKLPLSKIISVDADNFEEDGMIAVELTSGLQYIISKI